MFELAFSALFPPMKPEEIYTVRKFEELALMQPQVNVPIHHTLHAGMYARTAFLKKGVAISGALVKTETILCISGDCAVYVGEGSRRFTGYHVVSAAANRKQVFVAFEDTNLTMLFPTTAKTVKDAEKQFTDEFSSLTTSRGA